MARITNSNIENSNVTVNVGEARTGQYRATRDVVLNQKGVEIISNKSFRERLYTLLSNPFRYLFKGRVEW